MNYTAENLRLEANQWDSDEDVSFPAMLRQGANAMDALAKANARIAELEGTVARVKANRDMYYKKSGEEALRRIAAEKRIAELETESKFHKERWTADSAELGRANRKIAALEPDSRELAGILDVYAAAMRAHEKDVEDVLMEMFPLIKAALTRRAANHGNPADYCPLPIQP